MDYTNISNSGLLTLPGLCCCPQHTIPLLMDDCLSVLQKICALWAKLNELITNYNNYLDNFSSWKSEVENVLTDLQTQITNLDNKVTTLENTISDIQNDISTLENTIAEIQNSISDISDIQNTLSTLENTITEMQNDISTLEKTIAKMQNNMRILDNSITDLSNKVDDIYNTLSSLQNDVTTLYNNISDITTRLTTAENNITTLTNAINTLESRIEELEKLLENLHVEPPVEIMTNDDFTSTQSNWFSWFQTVYFGSSTALSSLGWTTVNTLTYWDPEVPIATLSVGVVGQNVVLAKLPYICYKKAAISASQSTPDRDAVETALSDELALYDYTAIAPGDAFFDVTLSKALDFQPDEIKFATSYIPFLPRGSRIFKILSMTNSTTYLYDTKCVNNNVRLQVIKGSLTAKMCIAPQDLYVAVCPDDDFGDSAPTSACTWSLYLYCIAENF